MPGMRTPCAASLFRAVTPHRSRVFFRCGVARAPHKPSFARSRSIMLALDSDPVVAIATAPGRGGIGVVRVSCGRAGAQAALALMSALCGQAIAPRHASYVPFLDAGGNVLDRGIALY